MADDLRKMYAKINSSDEQRRLSNYDDKEEERPRVSVDLSLGYQEPSPTPPRPPPEQPPCPPVEVPRRHQLRPSPMAFKPYLQPALSSMVEIGPHRRHVRQRRNPQRVLREGKSEIIPPPYPWATNRRAVVHSYQHLVANNILSISGKVRCRRCEEEYEMHYDLREKFREVGTYVARNKYDMCDRAPDHWEEPTLPTCQSCRKENSVRPVMAPKKKQINWLFLFLSQLVACCTLDQLKYFCKHTGNHRTGAKNRLIYLTYLAICKQLDPRGPFDP